jgi:transcriptional regulator with XRE-family HTH domain
MSQETGARIKARRKELALSQGVLATAVGVTIGAVSQWEAGAVQVLGKNLMKLASALSTTPEWLMSGGEQSAALQVDIPRLARALELLDSLPKVQLESLSHAKRAKLITYLYNRNLAPTTSKEVRELAGLVE